MIIPNIPITIVKNAGFDLYGQDVLGTRTKEKCAVVKMIQKSQRTTVRVDSGATRHSAAELVADVVLLLMANTVAKIDDIIETPHVNVRVDTLHARYAVTGKFDHWEAGCSIE